VVETAAKTWAASLPQLHGTYQYRVVARQNIPIGVCVKVKA
jgi:hypothetical protein